MIGAESTGFAIVFHPLAIAESGGKPNGFLRHPRVSLGKEAGVNAGLFLCVQYSVLFWIFNR